MASFGVGVLLSASLLVLALPNVEVGWAAIILMLSAVFIFTFVTVFREMRERLYGDG